MWYRNLIFNKLPCESRLHEDIRERYRASGNMFQPTSERGFVLPYVLAVLAILSLISVLGANILRTNSNSVFAMTNTAQLSSALDDAEQMTIFMFATRPMVSGGMDLSYRPVDQTAIVFGDLPDESELAPGSVWHANRESRTVQVDGLRVDIEYQDVAGLVSLNTGEQDIIELLLKALLSEPSTAGSLTAKLVDYRDSDTRRSFMGGERADYRMKGLRLPTNSSIRTLQELNLVLDWQLTDSELATLMLNSTVAPTAGFPAPRRMSEELRDSLAAGKTTSIFGPLLDLTENEIVTSRYPSETGRFTLTAYGRQSGLALRRIIEIERTAGSPNLPFQRRLVAEFPIGPDANQTSLENVHRPIPFPWSPST